jgi:hypothetical protein
MDDRIAAVLRREMSITELTPEEREVALRRVGERYTTPNPEIEAAYAALSSTAGATEGRQKRLAEAIMAEDAEMLRELAASASPSPKPAG